jgi:hypothetical protein
MVFFLASASNPNYSHPNAGCTPSHPQNLGEPALPSLAPTVYLYCSYFCIAFLGMFGGLPPLPPLDHGYSILWGKARQQLCQGCTTTFVLPSLQSLFNNTPYQVWSVITHCFESRGGILPVKLNIISSLRSSLRRLMVQAPFNSGLQPGAEVPNISTV